MLGQKPSLSIINDIKRIARQLKKELRLKHTGALDQAARKVGFENFRHALNKCKSSSQFMASNKAILLPKFQFRLTQYWADRKTKLRGYESIEISLTKPLNNLISLERLRLARGFARVLPINDLEYQLEFITHSQLNAQSTLLACSRILSFMDATGLLPSSGFRKAYPTRHWHIPSQDHATYWFEPRTRRYLIADEPYQHEFNSELHKRKEWLTTHGYAMQTPTWLGMYNPYMDENNGSRLHLISHGERGINLDQVVSVLNGLDMPVGDRGWTGSSGKPTPI